MTGPDWKRPYCDDQPSVAENIAAIVVIGGVCALALFVAHQIFTLITGG